MLEFLFLEGKKFNFLDFLSTTGAFDLQKIAMANSRKSAEFFVFVVKNRWIGTLEDGKYAKKYKLIPQKHFKGRRLKFIDDSDGEKDIFENLEDIGISDDKDKNSIIKCVKKLVKNVKRKKKSKKSQKKKKKSEEASDDVINPVDDSSDFDPNPESSD